MRVLPYAPLLAVLLLPAALGTTALCPAGFSIVQELLPPQQLAPNSASTCAESPALLPTTLGVYGDWDAASVGALVRFTGPGVDVTRPIEEHAARGTVTNNEFHLYRTDRVPLPLGFSGTLTATVTRDGEVLASHALSTLV